MLMHFGEKGSITCMNKSQTVLIDLCRCTKQTSRTYFLNLFDIILTSKHSAVSGLPAHKQMRARPRQVGNPGTTHSAVVPPSTMPPKHSLDGATGEETVSL